MTVPQQQPAFIRTLKARLLVLVKRPMFWGSAAVIILATILGIEYLTHPERLRAADGTAEGNADRRVVPTGDDQIGADIDNLPVLFSDILPEGAEVPEADNPASSLLDASDFATGLSTDEGDKDQPERPDSSSFYEGLFDSSPSQGEGAQGLTPSISSFLGTTQTADAASELGNSASGSVTSSPFSVPTPNATAQSPLQQQFATPVSGTAQTRPGGEPQAGRSPTAPALGNYGLPQTSTQFPAIQTSPQPGTTGYIQPPSLRVPSNPYGQFNTPQYGNAGANPTFTSPNLTGTYGAPPVATPGGNLYGTPLQTPGTSSSPYPTIQNNPYAQPNYTLPPGAAGAPVTSPQGTRPRRFTGGGRGGRINTFSNP